MVSIALHRFSLILGACIASALSLGVLLLILRPALPPPSPAAILPATETVALFPSITEERLQDFAGLFPMLAGLPASETPLALLTYSCGEGCTDTGWALFHDEEVEGGEKVGSWHVRASSPDVMALLSDTGTGRLLNARPFQTAVHDRASDVYLSPQFLPRSSNLEDQLLHTLLQGSTALALGETQSGWTLAINGAASPLSQSVATNVQVQTDIALTASIGDARRLWQFLEDAIEPGQRSILSSLVSTTVERTLGPDVSFTYDVLPLLQKPVVLVATSGSGVTFAIEGSMDDRTVMAETLTRLQESMRRHLSQMMTVARTFDNRFPSVLLKQETSLLEIREGEEEDWSLIEISHRETGEGLVTARSGDRYAIGNDADLLRRVLRGEGVRVSFAPGTRATLAGGQVDLAELQAVITETPWKRALFGPVLRYRGPLTWSVTRSGDRTVVSFEKL
ncbi:hypothetical protein HYZ99_00815 [Candidatus Peregrinibacteria bacterium]|nr:hypothetical protein [Candidatus Peregrinibacteria bacterium]